MEVKDAELESADTGSVGDFLDPHPLGGEDQTTVANRANGVHPVVPVHPPLWNNIITIIGAMISALSLMLLLTFGLFHLVTPTTNPYVDIVGFLILPCAMMGGFILMFVGIVIKTWRLNRANPNRHLRIRFPRVDLNDYKQRRVAKIVLAVTFVMLPVVGVSSYHGYHYTDSTEFCGKVCHSVMEPQAVAYEHSSHARVPCAECHIGSGASWFVKSKLSGTRQVLAVWSNTFSRPISSAITELRPARDTCEQCHWPQKFYGAQLHEIVRYSSDEKNTRHEIDMLLKIGGGDETTGRAEGIHMHMALSGRIEYVATDDTLQEIPWVRYVDNKGAEWIYRSDGRPHSDPMPEGVVRQMDCMDCHNRPAHKFRSPEDAVDICIEVGKIDVTLPYIKREAVASLMQNYPDADTAEKKIGQQISEFYLKNYPDLMNTREFLTHVNNAIDEVRVLYRRNFFPEMHVDWRTYPDNIGHKNSPGCFRCHEGKHVNQSGKTISQKCDICHTFLNPIASNDSKARVEEGQFIHPFELQGTHATIRCDQCHTGGGSPATTCDGCHTEQTMFRQGVLTGFESMKLQADTMTDIVDCDGCHDLEEPTTITVINEQCMDCHDDEEEKYEGMLVSWKKEIVQLTRKARQAAQGQPNHVLDALLKAGPLHNIEASRVILRKLINRDEKPTKPKDKT